MKKGLSIYMAGGLFDIATRIFNLALAKALREIYPEANVILPQEEAAKYFSDNNIFDMEGCSKHCADQASTCDVILGNLDGADADSGTALEIGIALWPKNQGVQIPERPIVICYRTDFRTSLQHEVGINGMFNLADKILYEPAYVTAEEDMAIFISDLAKNIATAIDVFALSC